MSHFAVAVIMDGRKSLEDILERFNENPEGEYGVFEDLTEECHMRYKTETVRKVRMASDGSFVHPRDEQFQVEISQEEYDVLQQDPTWQGSRVWKDGQYRHYRFEYGENVVDDFPVSEVYPDFEHFVSEYCGYDRNDESETPKYGYWYNPDAKWDWWQLGGRWAGMLKAKKGSNGELSLVCPAKVENGYYDMAKIGDIDFSPNQKEYDDAIRFWEVYVDGEPLREGENPADFESGFYTKEYFKEHYGSKEQYAREASELCTFAVIDVDGEWHEKGAMGWFGLSSETGEESQNWHNSWYDRFIKDANPEWTLAIVDCHI